MSDRNSVQCKLNSIIKRAIDEPERYHPERWLYKVSLLEDGTRTVCNVYGKPVLPPPSMERQMQVAMKRLDEVWAEWQKEGVVNI